MFSCVATSGLLRTWHLMSQLPTNRWTVSLRVVKVLVQFPSRAAQSRLWPRREHSSCSWGRLPRLVPKNSLLGPAADRIVIIPLVRLRRAWTLSLECIVIIRWSRRHGFVYRHLLLWLLTEKSF